LTSDDVDNSADLYQRAGSVTTRLSQAAGTGNGAFPANFAGLSADGAHVFFTTAEKLTGDDTDAQIDIYDRNGSTTTRVSQGAINGNGPFPAAYRGASSDGTHMFFETPEKLASGDTDAVTDVYGASGP